MTETNETVVSKTPFKTKDLNFAAFIWYQDEAKLVGCRGRREKGTTVFFCFELAMTEEQLSQLQIDYANGDTIVEPQKFIAKQNNLRDLLHASLATQRVEKDDKDG